MSTKSFDSVVIGSGPGGYVCAIRLAQLGQKTAIVEKENLGGVCLNVGCIPSKALIHASSQFWKAQNEYDEMGISAKSVDVDLEKMQEWKSGVVKKLTGGVGQLLKANGVEIIKGHATFTGKNEIDVKGVGKVQAKNFVIATGSRPLEIPPLPYDGKQIVTSTEALELKKLPKNLVVVGGGFIGVEIGVVYAKLGSKVTIVEALDQILAAVDADLVRVVQKKMRKLGIDVLTKAKAQGVEKGKSMKLKVETAEGPKKIDADVILVSIGRVPNSDKLGIDKAGVQLDKRGNILIDRQGKTNVPGIWAIGDVAGAPQLAHRASMDGLLVAAAISGEKAYRDYKTVPWAVFCDPEIATCGLTEKEAKEQGFDYSVGTFPFAANGRALSTNDSEGFIKVLVENKTEQILGVHIVGPEASNLIAEATLAIEMGACAEDIARTIHTHPTLPEAFPEAVEAAFFKAVHIYKPPRKKR